MTARSPGGATIHRMASSYRQREISPWQMVQWIVIGSLMFWPRLFILAFLIFDRDIGRAFGSWVVPLIGFFVLPWTTLAYAAMWSVTSESVNGIEWAVVGFALLVDLYTWVALRS
jgi:hypothetical protein